MTSSACVRTGDIDKSNNMQLLFNRNIGAGSGEAHSNIENVESQSFSVGCHEAQDLSSISSIHF